MAVFFGVAECAGIRKEGIKPGKKYQYHSCWRRRQQRRRLVAAAAGCSGSWLQRMSPAALLRVKRGGVFQREERGRS